MEEKDKQHIADRNDKMPKSEQDEKAGKAYITGGENRATRPEQGPDVPADERTAGIP